MTKRSATVFVGIMMLFSYAGMAQAEKEFIGDPKQGAVKSALCQGCHGGDGNSMTPTFPRLANQYAGYIVKQVSEFKSGKRHNNSTMAGMANTVASLADLKDIASYFASKPMAGQPLSQADEEAVARGKKIFYEGIPEKGVYACVNCHGELGKGKAPNISVFPRIGGQHKAYLIKELKDFKGGLRDNDPAGMMQNIARRLDESEMQDVADYLSTLLPGNM